MTPSSRFAWCKVLFLLALLPPAAHGGGIRPIQITATQSRILPFRESGKFLVTLGGIRYYGTATLIRRFTGLTAGHLFYDPDGGFATDPVYEPGYYLGKADASPTVGYFAVLAGYQDAADNDPNSSPAFARDMGYFVVEQPAARNEWPNWTYDPNVLTGANTFLALGYASEHQELDRQSVVENIQPFTLDQPGLYQNFSYYTEEGMSGGPLYATPPNGNMAIAGITVAGTSYPDQPESAVRAITPDERDLFIEAEYEHGPITGGVITGPATVPAGGSAVFKSGVTFVDGVSEGQSLTRRYPELTLVPRRKNRSDVTVSKVKMDKFRVRFASSLPSGKRIVLLLQRDSATGPQAPLGKLVVTVK